MCSIRTFGPGSFSTRCPESKVSIPLISSRIIKVNLEVRSTVVLFSGSDYFSLYNFAIELTNSSVCSGSSLTSAKTTTCASEASSLDQAETYTYLCSPDAKSGRYLFIQIQDTSRSSNLILGEVSAYQSFPGTFQATCAS